MNEFWSTQLIYILRLFVAMVCGIAIGLERKNKLKTAGIATHATVAMASALMMVVSKYGFFDVITKDSINLDPSRIAAGVVTAISFLGAGVIFTHKMTVSGITTAAGLWTTVGIGIAIGAGMYLPGICGTAMILILQFIVHRKHRLLKAPTMERIVLILDEQKDIHELFDRVFVSKKIELTNVSVERISGNKLRIKLYVKFPDAYSIENVINLLKEMPEILSVEL